MFSNRLLAASAVLAALSGVAAWVFHGHKPFADVAFVALVLFALPFLAGCLVRMLRRRRGAMTATMLLCAAAAAALVAGITPAAARSATVITKAAWITRADAICTAAGKRVGAIPEPKVNPANPSRTDLRTIAGYLARLQPVLAREVRDVGMLPAPAADARLAARFILWARKSVAALRTSANAAAAGNLSAYRASFRRDSVYGTAASAAARRFGLRVCGQ